MESFPGVGGEIVVILALCSSFINFVISETVQYFVDAVGYGWVMVFFGLCVALSLVGGMVVYYCGKSWRRRCAARYYRFLAERNGE